MNDTPDPSAQVEAVLDVLAPKLDLLPGKYSQGDIRFPIIRLDYDGQAIMPSDGQLRALAEQIVTAIRTASQPGQEIRR